MTRAASQTRARAAIFLRANGICHLCGGKITPGEAWDVSHEIPLALGGADDESNMRPAHANATGHGQPSTTSRPSPRPSGARPNTSGRIAERHPQITRLCQSRAAATGDAAAHQAGRMAGRFCRCLTEAP